MPTHTGSSRRADVAASRLSEKIASRNGPRRSVYWVQCRRDSGSSPSDGKRTNATPDMGSGAGRVTYSVTGKYTGDWKDGEKHGYGVFVYANGSKYEGEWVRDKRHGKGTYWVGDKGKARKQYAGDWRDDKRHGMGTCFFEDGCRYDGLCEHNKRQGTGRRVYQDGSMYEGHWLSNQRSGHGVLVLPNGDRYDGHWLKDKKEGPGRFFYKATRKVYEGEWVEDSPKCGTYHDDDSDLPEDNDFAPRHAKVHDRFHIPELGLAHPEHVVSESIAYIRQERVLEKAFRSHHISTTDSHDGGGRDSNDGVDEDDGGVNSSVVFDDATMKALQHEFHSIEQHDGTIQCEALPHMLRVLGLAIENGQILAFLDEIGASPETAISFAECVDILSLLAESFIDGGVQEDGSHGGGGDDEYDSEEEEEEED